MKEGALEDLERSVLVLAPTGKDAALTRQILDQARVRTVLCRNLDEVFAQLELGAGAVLLAEEAVSPAGSGPLRSWLGDQPPWSDLPVLVLARPGADSHGVAQAMDLLGNVTVLERPMRVAALVSAVRSALRARQRQYQIREHLAARESITAELQANDRRKDEFLAMLAHELRNPLAPISNALHILRLSGEQDATTERLAAMIERQVNHMVRLVDDLLEVSRITRGRIELRKEPVDVAAVILSAVETSRPQIVAARHELSLSLPSDALILEADPVRLAQVFANLLNNAAKYTDPGGQIWVTGRREGDSVVVSVRDSGTGIAPDMLGRVFDLFAQVDRHAARAQGGLGIGLTLVRSLVEMHGGTAQAHSGGLGRGTEFIVRLPLSSTREYSDAPAAAARPHSVLGTRRVLVVDDNRDAAESLGRLLEILGTEVQIAHSGQGALDAIETYRPAVVVMDIGMPDMDGYEVSQRIREQPEFQHVTLIALTGWGQSEDRRRSQLAGFDYHLTKPVDINVLQSLLSSLESRGAGEPRH